MKAWHITKYTFAADEHDPEAMERWATSELRAEGVLPHEIERAAQAGPTPDVGVLAHRSEGVLYLLASKRGVNYNDAKTYDSGDFPKPVFASDE